MIVCVPVCLLVVGVYVVGGVHFVRTLCIFVTLSWRKKHRNRRSPLNTNTRTLTPLSFIYFSLSFFLFLLLSPHSIHFLAISFPHLFTLTSQCSTHTKDNTKTYKLHAKMHISNRIHTSTGKHAQSQCPTCTHACKKKQKTNNPTPLLDRNWWCCQTAKCFSNSPSCLS